MGAENSKSEQKNQASREAYESMLKMQREIYEEKIKDLKRKKEAAERTKLLACGYLSGAVQSGIARDTHPVLPASAKTTLQNNMSPLPQFRSAAPLNQRADPSTSQTAGLERQRTPYNYADINLPSSSQKNVLYPNLKKDSSPLRTTNEFVFVNTNFTPTQSSNVGSKEDFTQRSQPTPSAPPANFLEPTSRYPRSRSQSRSRIAHKENTTHNDAADGSTSMLKCPTCNNMYTLTVYQCTNGHSSCKNCKMRGVSCGICSLRIGNMRNIALEAFIAEQIVSCGNANNGCVLKIKMCDLEIHAKECPFKELKCPKLKCPWRGKLSAVVSHFNDRHPEHCVGNVDKEMYLSDIRNNSNTMYLVEIGPYIFIVHLKVSATESKLYMAVQLVGTSVSAMKWTYELNIYNKREPRRKYQYVDICQTNSTPIEDIFSQTKCAAIPLSYANTFYNEGRLTYKFFIRKGMEGNRGYVKNYRGRGGKR